MTTFDLLPSAPQPRGTRVVVGRGGRPGVERAAAALPLVDPVVRARHGRRLDELLDSVAVHRLPELAVPGGEEVKDAERLAGWYRELDARQVERGTLVVAAGGGALLDLAGFLAGTWLRGLPLCAVATTLLAAVDAGLGGKCGINLDGVKNRVGLVRQPRLLVVDPDMLATQPAATWRSGLGEVVKTALLAGGGLVEAARSLGPHPGEAAASHLEEVVAGCLRYKAAVVAEDPGEQGPRMHLNLGHTVGHLLESLARDGGRPVPHGVAVAAGLAAEAAALWPRGEAPEVLRSLLQELELADRLAVPWDEGRARHLLERDKKRRGAGYLVPVLEAPGRPVLVRLGPEELLEAARGALAP